jgi:hypothetical protein
LLPMIVVIGSSAACLMACDFPVDGGPTKTTKRFKGISWLLQVMRLPVEATKAVVAKRQFRG